MSPGRRSPSRVPQTRKNPPPHLRGGSATDPPSPIPPTMHARYRFGRNRPPERHGPIRHAHPANRRRRPLRAISDISPFLRFLLLPSFSIFPPFPHPIRPNYLFSNVICRRAPFRTSKRLLEYQFTTPHYMVARMTKGRVCVDIARPRILHRFAWGVRIRAF